MHASLSKSGFERLYTKTLEETQQTRKTKAWQKYNIAAVYVLRLHFLSQQPDPHRAKHYPAASSAWGHYHHIHGFSVNHRPLGSVGPRNVNLGLNVGARPATPASICPRRCCTAGSSRSSRNDAFSRCKLRQCARGGNVAVRDHPEGFVDKSGGAVEDLGMVKYDEHVIACLLPST